ncbi:MerR family transcriptional regulator [Saccharothrix xinjiangensis]|uniref:MerR family transcriptional regulator n=1 Tax=Saccharothrix xinjiangensis TaxID=204798 RepID=A0ABV9Y4T5_9PSEU
MRIGELAALVGVSTRAVRHYHQRGLLDEPARQANGYREYGLRDVVVLARIRRLTELGLSLDEVRDALGNGRDLHEILVELDGDLAAQETRLRERRARLAGLIERTGPHADDAVAPELLALLDDLADRPPTPLADRERELLALMDTTATRADRDRVVAALRDRAADPAAARRDQELGERLTALADAEVDDPRVEALAADLSAALPAELLAGGDAGGPFAAAVLDTLGPAQAEVVRRVLRRAGTA